MMRLLFLPTFLPFNPLNPFARRVQPSPARRDDGPADDTATNQHNSNTADGHSSGRGSQRQRRADDYGVTGFWMGCGPQLIRGSGGEQEEDDTYFALSDADRNPTIDDDDDDAPVLGNVRLNYKTDGDDDDG